MIKRWRDLGPGLGRSFGFGLCLGLGVSVFAAGLLAPPAAAQSPMPPASIPGQPGAAPPAAAEQPPPSNPVCVRLESQLASLNRGGGDPARAEQIKRYEDSAGKQQADLDRLLAQAKQRGCESGFFSLFTGQAPRMPAAQRADPALRDNLDRTMSDLERLKSGNNYDQEGQRRQLIGELAQNNCGPQYRAAAAAAGPSGFLDSLFGGAARIINPGGDGAPSGTFRTVCVRSCDGYYFPISYSTVQSRFADDQRTCQRECPATEAQLYTYRNPGEDMDQAVSLGGQPYTALPAAFQYRKEFNAACSCRRPGQSWADALKGADDASTLESGDIVVTDQNAKALSQPAAPPRRRAPSPESPRPARPRRSLRPVRLRHRARRRQRTGGGSRHDPRSAKGSVRTVGPPFVAAH